MDYYGFYMGQEYQAYRYLGAQTGDGGTVFRTFAPSAVDVSVIGDFNNWQCTPMRKVYDGNFWECEIENAERGQMYKYRITDRTGRVVDHCDPYGFFSEKRPNTASIIWDIDRYNFHDDEWMRKRDSRERRPLNIYEIHFGSWRQKSDSCYSYGELAEVLLPYLKETGYNYLELMPLNEYPSDASWGYQPTGFFSPTSRYGTPDELKFFIEQCHKNGIGVILDFVPVHFAVDDYALWNYDGTALYEYPNTDVGRSEWGSCNFMHSRGEVRSFLLSSAYYWLSEFHFDGLRMDAVNNLIYWQGNAARGENQSALKFLRDMNSRIKSQLPGVILIAEDSSSHPGVTRPIKDGGLGFDYKWDLGWMNDTLSVFQMPQRERREHYHKLTFSMMYFADEKYLLPLSHDECVHGKATILQKMNGDYEAKFPQARVLYMYMMSHPGKKLNFMGNEFGQLREWDESREQDWSILTYPAHSGFLQYMTTLNHLYLEHPAMYAEDYDNSGFTWLDCHQEAKCVYAFERCGGGERLAFIFNLSDEAQDFDVHVEKCDKLTPLLSTNEERYGGTERELECAHSSDGTFSLLLAPLSGICFKIE